MADMAFTRLQANSPFLISALGVVLFLIALIHHGQELSALNGLVGPVIAFLLDGLPALALAYAGYWLSGTDLSPKDRWRVCSSCLLGGILFVAVMGVSLWLRAYEGRVIGEAIFPLLIAFEAGGIAGVFSGYALVRAENQAVRAQTATNALEFVNNLIRHDLRNDLNMIQGQAALINSDVESMDIEVVSNNVSVIAEKSDEALARIEITGALAKTIMGEPELERVDLASITDEMATRIGNSYGVEVTTDLPDQALVSANAGLRSVVDNLIENAVAHNDADDQQVHVEVERADDSVTLSVADNGPGIPDDVKEEVLAPQSNETTGGGLTLVRTLVEGYGGEVWVEDNEPKGSVFNISPPRADNPPD